MRKGVIVLRNGNKLYSSPYTKVSEMSAREFFAEYPEALDKLPVSMRLDFLSDDNYIVRVSSHGIVEIGYASDSWRIA